jgi:hypothetical protein
MDRERLSRIRVRYSPFMVIDDLEAFTPRMRIDIKIFLPAVVYGERLF